MNLVEIQKLYLYLTIRVNPVSLQCTTNKTSVMSFCAMHLSSVDHGKEVGKDNERHGDDGQPDSAVIGGLFYHLILLQFFICNSQ